MAGLPKIFDILGGCMGTTSFDKKELDKEWVELILIALNLGIHEDEIRNFINGNTKT